jgi:hypothetical protein
MPADESKKMTIETLAYFKHHPEASDDFCIEVDCIRGMAYDAANGIRSQWPFWSRLSAALGWARRNPMADDYMERAHAQLVTIEPDYQAGRFDAANFRP